MSGLLGSVTEYQDDGWSGLDFFRPGLQRMLADVEAGKINTIIVKDMSRFGRLNAMVQYYVELVFPQSGVRLIAVNDNYDSDEGDNDMLPFRTILNEWYG